MLNCLSPQYLLGGIIKCHLLPKPLVGILLLISKKKKKKDVTSVIDSEHCLMALRIDGRLENEGHEWEGRPRQGPQAGVYLRNSAVRMLLPALPADCP